MQQFHLGLVNDSNGLVVWLRELLDDSGHGVTALLGVVTMKEWKLLIDSGQSCC